MKTPFKGGIVFSQRVDLKLVVREQLKAMGVTDVTSVVEMSELQKLSKLAVDFLVVIDWELGEKSAIVALSFLKQDPIFCKNSVLLISAREDTKILTTALEYNVTAVRSGELTQNDIRDVLRDVAKLQSINHPLNAVFSRVKEAKACGNQEEALMILEGVRAKVPNNPRVICDIAEILIEQSKLDDAVGLLEPLTRLEVPYVRSIHLIARCMMKQRKYKEATTLLSMAKSMSPHNVERMIDLGHVYLALDKVDEAKEEFKAASSIDPQNKNAKQGLGQTMLMSGEVNEAITLLQHVSSKQELASIFNLSAVVSINNGRYDEGMRLYDTAMKVVESSKPLQSRLLYNKGLGFKKQSFIDESIECLKQSINLDPDFQKAKTAIYRIAEEHNIELSQEFLPVSVPSNETIGRILSMESDDEVLPEALSKESSDSNFKSDASPDSLTASQQDESTPLEFGFEEDFSDDLDDLFGGSKSEAS